LDGNQNSGLLNLLYNQDDSAGRLDYFMFDLQQLSSDKSSWVGENLISRPGVPVSGNVRAFWFHGTTSQSLVAWISPSGTLRILTPQYANEILRGSPLTLNLSYLSRPSKWISDGIRLPDGPPLQIFGPEPRNWLYFYQKAELERQLGDWDAVARLGDEATKQGFKPIDHPSGSHLLMLTSELKDIKLRQTSAIGCLTNVRTDWQRYRPCGCALSVRTHKMQLI
jgi:hypothetical protein